MTDDPGAVGRAGATFAEAAHVFANLLHAVPAPDWDGPGLGEWDLRALVGHTSRSLLTVEIYLQQPAEAEDVPSAAAYYAAIAGIDPASVARRGRDAGANLGEDPVAAVTEIVLRVLPLTERDDDPLVTTAGGGMRLSQYLPTRTVELVVHGFDIAHALRVEPPRYSETVLSEVVSVTAQASVVLGRGLDVLLALTGRRPLPNGFSVT